MIKNIVLCTSYSQGFAHAEAFGKNYSGKDRDTAVFVINGWEDADRALSICAKLAVDRKNLKIDTLKGVQPGYRNQISDYFFKM
jgi:hypothetical protein